MATQKPGEWASCILSRFEEQVNSPTNFIQSSPPPADATTSHHEYGINAAIKWFVAKNFAVKVIWKIEWKKTEFSQWKRQLAREEIEEKRKWWEDWMNEKWCESEKERWSIDIPSSVAQFTWMGCKIHRRRAQVTMYMSVSVSVGSTSERAMCWCVGVLFWIESNIESRASEIENEWLTNDCARATVCVSVYAVAVYSICDLSRTSHWH